MTRTTAAFPMHPASASMQAPAYGNPYAYSHAHAGVVPGQQPAAPREHQPLSHESRCFILADMDRAARSDNKVCVSCAVRLSSEQRRHTVELSSGRRGCTICDLKASKPESFTKPFCQFLTENPTIFHAVVYFKEKLNAVGFTEVSWLQDDRGYNKRYRADLLIYSSQPAMTGPTRSNPAANTTSRATAAPWPRSSLGRPTSPATAWP